MQRSSLAFLLVIASLAGFTLRTVAFQSPSAFVHPSEVAEREIAMAFYNAMNTALSGAPDDELGALLSPIFVDHETDSGATQSAGEFLDHLRAIGSTYQQVRLEVLAVEPAGSSLVVNIQQVQDKSIQVAGMSVEPVRSGPLLEVLRVERGKIVDRWSHGYSWPDVSTIEGKPPAISSTVGISNSLVRVDLAGSSEQSWQSLGIGIVMVETGAVFLHMTDRYGATTSSKAETGAITSVPSGTRTRLRSADGNPASVVIYLATHLGASDVPLPVKWEDDAGQAGSRTVLWSGQIFWSGTDIIHQPARIVLPVGGEIELTRPPDAELLLGSNASVVEIRVPGGSVEVLGEDRWPEEVPGVVLIDSSHAVSISGDGTVFVRNLSDAPVTLVLISIEKAPISDV